MKKIILSCSKGFTLIELLTVISIISILTALLTVAFVSVGARSRDTQRKSNIKQIQAALELYKADNDAYPASGIIMGIACNAAFTGGTAPTQVTYMTKFPCDPKNITIKYSYVSPTTSTYYLTSCLENSGDKDRVIGTVTNLTSSWTCSPATYFQVTNP